MPKTAHPKYSDMIVAAVKALGGKGASRQAINKYIVKEYNLKEDNHHSVMLRSNLKRVSAPGGSIVHSKGKGAAGSFKLRVQQEKAPAKKVAKKPATKKSPKKKIAAKKQPEVQDKKAVQPKEEKKTEEAKPKVAKPTQKPVKRKAKSKSASPKKPKVVKAAKKSPRKSPKKLPKRK